MLKLSKNTLGMLIAKYRAVLLRMLRKEAVALAVSGLLAAPTTALAAEYHVGAGQAYATLEALRTAAVSYADGDTITLHQDDTSLTSPLDFGGKAVTLQGGGSGAIILKPSAGDIRLFTASSGSAALAPALVLEGFVNTAAGDAGRGGVLRIENGASVDAWNVTFKNNQTSGGFDADNNYSGGAAVFVTGAGSRLNAEGAIFQDNQAAATGGIGGALYMRDGGAATAHSALFTGNTAHFGGGFYVTGNSTLDIDNAVFTGNTAATSGGGGYIGGSGVTASGAQFSGNIARWGGAFYVGNSSALTANNARFSNNQAYEDSSYSGGWGGAVNLNGSTMTAHHAVFTDNSAGVGGGALNIYNGSFTGDGVTFTGNTSVVHGGVAYLNGGASFIADGASFSGNQAEQCGGALYVISVVHDEATGTDTIGVPSTVALDNAVFTGNQAGIGGAGFVGTGGVLTVSNAQFTGNTADSLGGAILLQADYGDAAVNIHTDTGKTTLFSGNRHQVKMPGAGANAIAIAGQNNSTAYLTVDGAGILDMRDPLMSIYTGSSYDADPFYDAVIIKNGAGVWKLAGDSRLDTNGATGTTFTVNAGTLDLYNNAGIMISQGSFTLANGAALISRGGNTIAAPTVSLGNNSTLGFDLTGATADGAAALILNGSSALDVNPASQYIDILALDGNGSFKLVTANGISTTGKTLTLRGESFGNTRAGGSLAVSGGNTLQLDVTAQNGVMRWNGGSGDWNAADANWTGINTSGTGGVDLSGENKFLHGDAVVFNSAAGGQIAIQADGVQVALRPDVIGGNPGLIIAAGDWSFTGGALDGGDIRFSGDGGIAFDSRSLTQRITVDSGRTATIGALDGHTLVFTGHSEPGDGGVIAGASGSHIILSGSGSLNFMNNTARYGGVVYSSQDVSISSGTNSFIGNTGQYGGAVFSLFGTIMLTDSVNRFTTNTATTWGGAIHADMVTLANSDNTFTGNTAEGDYGGAIYADKTIEISGGSNTFTGNAVNGHGGAISTQTATFSGGTNRFEGNTAKQSGGAILATDITFSGGDNRFSGNTAASHGGVISAHNVTLSGNAGFTGNITGLYGGAIYAEKNVFLAAVGGDVIFRNNLQSFDSATGTGEANAIYLSNNGGGNSMTLSAAAGHSLLFFDPVASNGIAGDLTITINPGTADTGTIRFDKYQSNLYSNTTIKGGALTLTDGAIYGADTNTGSFTLASGARFSVDAAGGTINAGAVTLQDGSITAVDISSGNRLTLNGAVTLADNATLDLTGYSPGAAVLISDQAISGDFTRLTAGGQTLDATPSSLSKFLNGAILYKTNGDTTLNVLIGGLVWNNTSPGSQAHGTFDIATSFTLADTLADNTTITAHGFGWDGKTLTKAGAGSLSLTGANTYGGGTLLNAGTLAVGHDSALGSGSLTMTGGTTLRFAGSHSLDNAVTLNGSATVNHAADSSASLTGIISGNGGLTKTGEGELTLTGANTYTGGTIISTGRLTVNSLTNLGSGSIMNNAELYFAPSAGKQTIDFASRYAGSGTIGLNASLTASAQWSDLVKFVSAPQDDTKVFFTFTADSDLKYMTADGLHFAGLATADGNNETFRLEGTSLFGVKELAVKTTDNQNYYLNAAFNPSAAKVYSETAAGTLGQAAGLHGQETFKHIGQAAAGAAGGQTGVYAGTGRGDVRHHSGSHADVKGNNVALALAWENGGTTWGVLGQKFDGSYTTTHSAQVGGATQSIHSAGDLKQHDFGLFAEYRPDDSGRYWQGLVKAGQSQNDFRADNANNGSRFRSGRSVFGLSVGGGYVKETAPSRSLETYQHLIYTRLGNDQVTDSLGQDIRFAGDDSVRLLAGMRWTLARKGKPDFYAGAAVDYEFNGKTSAAIDGSRADSADLQGLTGILELGFSAKQSETLSIDGAVYGYVGQKEGLSGSLTLTKKF